MIFHKRVGNAQAQVTRREDRHSRALSPKCWVKPGQGEDQDPAQGFSSDCWEQLVAGTVKAGGGCMLQPFSFATATGLRPLAV